jgi:hypothetical protein
MQSFFHGICLIVVGGSACLLAGCMDSSEANSGGPAARAVIDTSLPVPAQAVPADETMLVSQSEDAKPALSADELMEQAFLGTWQLEDHGTRTIEVKADGTASMHIELDFFASLVYGEEMTMELTWSVKDGVLTYSVVSGLPVESVERVVSDFGRERSYRVLELGDELIQLQDTQFPKNTYDWVSVGGSADRG